MPLAFNMAKQMQALIGNTSRIYKWLISAM